MKAKKIGRFREVCPRKLKNLPKEPCPLALLRIELVRDFKKESYELAGCPYYIHESTSNYCFWNYTNTDDFEQHTTKQMSQLLLISNAQIEKAGDLAVAHIDKLKHDPEYEQEIKDLNEHLIEATRGEADDTIYAIGSFSDFDGVIYDDADKEKIPDIPTNKKAVPEKKSSGFKARRICGAPKRNNNNLF
jgi:hypothetical protein